MKVVLEDHKHTGMKWRLVDVEAMHGHCLKTTLAWGLWAESQSETT